MKKKTSQSLVIEENALHSLLIESMYIGPQILRLNCGNGIFNYISNLDDALHNFVGFDIKYAGSYVTEVVEVLKFFNHHNVPFCWICEDIREQKLAIQLNSFKFIEKYSFWSMFHDKNKPLPSPNDQVYAEQVSIDVLKQQSASIADVMHYPQNYIELTLSHLDYSAGEKLRSYAAFLSNGTIAGFALMIEMSKKSTAILCMAGVIPKYRGMGAYRALVRIRMLNAYSKNLNLVITHAYENTSMPILEKYGMQKHHRYTVYQAPCQQKTN